MTTDPRPYKKDTLLILIAIVFFILAPVALLLGIWVDGRWGWTAVLFLLLACVFGAFSNYADEWYEKKGVRK